MNTYPKLLLAVAIFILIASGCKKNNSSPVNSVNDNIPTVTPVGTAVGTAVKQLIGVAGGSLTSSDGRIKLTIPPGALSASTNISIQAVTNNCPGGIGLAYDLKPEGTKFSTPASLTFHYGDSDLHGMTPLFLVSAFQDSTNAWQLDDVDKDVDSINKTATFDLTHFSEHALFPTWDVNVNPPELRSNQTANVEIILWLPVKNPEPGNPIYVAAHSISNSLVSNWKVGYGAQGGQDGTISGSGVKVIYKAPADIPKDKIVTVVADVQQPFTIRWHKGKIIEFATCTMYGDLKLISDVFSFNVAIFLKLKQTSFFYPDVYTDGATVDVDVKGTKATIGFTNKPPMVNPPSGMYGGSTITWIPDDNGEINIATAKATVSPGSFEAGSIAIDFTDIGTQLPKWLIKDNATGATKITGGQAVGGAVQKIEFRLDNKKPQLDTLFYDEYNFCYFTVTPKP